MASAQQAIRRLCSPTSILVVEDHLPQRIYLRELLLRLGASSVTESATAEQAISLIRTQSFELAMIDIMMPHHGAFGFLEQLEHVRHVPPLILCSALSRPRIASVVSRCEALGLPVLGSLKKPVAAESLLRLYHGRNAR